MVTPEHIVPEWYFLPFYAILRAMPDKVLGIVFMLLSIVILFVIPYFWEGYEAAEFVLFNRGILLFWIFNVLLLAYIGMMPIEYPFNILQYIAMFFYFILPISLISFKN